MDKESKKKIDDAIKKNLCMSKDKEGWDIVVGITCISYMRDDIIEALEKLGYRKIKGEPRLLKGCEDRPDCWRLTKQRDIAIKYYGGKK